MGFKPRPATKNEPSYKVVWDNKRGDEFEKMKLAVSHDNGLEVSREGRGIYFYGDEADALLDCLLLMRTEAREREARWQLELAKGFQSESRFPLWRLQKIVARSPLDWDDNASAADAALEIKRRQSMDGN